jgi:hypothetical protein
MKQTAKVIKFDKSLDIRNLAQLPHGTGAKYLEVMTSHEPDVYIAVQWRRTIISLPSDHLLVEL